MRIYTPLTLTAGSFQTDTGFDIHNHSSWQISSYSDFSVIQWESLEDQLNLTSITLLPENYLDTDTNYYWRVKYTGVKYGDSDWSSSGTFITPQSWTCVAGNLAAGGIMAGTVNNYCLIVAKYEAELSGTEDWWTAKQYCLNLDYDDYSDWYMPTYEELELINTNLIVIDSADTTGSFNSSIYWSSTVDVLGSKDSAWVNDFNDSSQTTYNRKNNSFYVRPVRRA